MLNIANLVEFYAEPDTRTSVLSFPLDVYKTKQNVKMVLVRLAFPINTYQNANQNAIRSVPGYQAQCTCTLPPDPIY